MDREPSQDNQINQLEGDRSKVHTIIDISFPFLIIDSKVFLRLNLQNHINITHQRNKEQLIYYSGNREYNKNKNTFHKREPFVFS